MDTWLRQTRLVRLRSHWSLVMVAYLGLVTVALVANGLLVGRRDRVTMPHEIKRLNDTHLSLHYRQPFPIGQTVVKMITEKPEPVDIVFFGYGTEGAIQPVPIAFKRHFDTSPPILISVNFDRLVLL